MNEPELPIIDVRPLFRRLDQKLMELLKSLKEADWEKQTVARHWKVKDVVSHLLDGNLRVLSMQRDKYFGEKPEAIGSYADLVQWLNQLNADWVEASKRLSPGVLILLHDTTGPLVSEYYESLDPEAEAIFAVDWAGETSSLNRMHLAREYTEKWHHQQQVRDAVGLDGIMTEEFFYPCMDTFFRALPHTFKEVEAKDNTLIQVTINAAVSHHWYLLKVNDSWTLISDPNRSADVVVDIPAEISWKLFSKSLRPEQIRPQVKMEGQQALGEHVLEMVSVMA